MRKLISQTLMAAAIGGAVLSATPASAQSFSISVGFPGIGFSYDSGGYCDRWGCPDEFWNYPIYYCPVYYGGRWYSGPVYYRYWRGTYLYWIHGGWRRDYWHGPRPSGACVDRYGPPLDLDFYIWNGFNIRDDWRYGWRHNRNDWWRHRRDWDRSNRYDTGWRNWLPAPQQNYDWNRERDWNRDRDWIRPDWNRRDWERKNNIKRGTNIPSMPPVSPFAPGGRPTTKIGPAAPPPQTAPVVAPPVVKTPPAETGGRVRHRLEGGQNIQGTGGAPGGAGTPPTPPTPQTYAPPAANKPPAELGGRVHRRLEGGQNIQGTGGTQGGTGTPPPPQPLPPKPHQPATTNPPSDNTGDHRKHRDGQDSQGTGSNNPQ